jgi:hypothetical protein
LVGCRVPGDGADYRAGLADRVAAGGEPVGLTTDPRRIERMLAN